MAEQLKPIYLAPAVHQAVKAEAYRLGINMQLAAAEALAMWLAAKKAKAPKGKS